MYQRTARPEERKLFPVLNHYHLSLTRSRRRAEAFEHPGGQCKFFATKKDRDSDRLHDVSHDEIDDRQLDQRPTSVMPVVHTIHERTTNDGAGNQSKKEAGSSPGVTIDEEPGPDDDRIAGELDVATYRHESGELYAEDVDQHMAVLHDIVTPTTEVAINDIQVGNPDVPLNDDQERLRQLI